jgi:CBS domain-containing protein
MTSTTLQPFVGDALIPPLDRATVADVMHHGLISCAPDLPAREVAAMMVTQRVHAVAVIGVSADTGGEHLTWSILSDLDLVGAAPDAAAGTLGRPVAAALVAEPRESLIAVARRMADAGTSHLIVVSETARCPIGVVSTLDVARAMAWGGGPGA